ncbi:MAG: hypothetical protein JOZ81_06855 [Chloroflexi bacterium]|nr:hypothetical protein [Chloroflexota bacterium]MBV9547850.1 hypothetical protein [Chloroflexota bacterium]
MLQYHYAAEVEYREWLREFNRRAARGEFVRHDLEQRPAEESRPRIEAWIAKPVLEPQA